MQVNIPMHLKQEPQSSHQSLPPIRELLGDSFETQQPAFDAQHQQQQQQSPTTTSFIPPAAWLHRSPTQTRSHSQSDGQVETSTHQQVFNRRLQQICGQVDRSHHTPYPSPQTSPRTSPQPLTRKRTKSRSARGVGAAHAVAAIQDESTSEDADAASSPRVIKKYRERNSRHKLSCGFSSLFEDVLNVNPNIMNEGISPSGTVGLTPLKSNNINLILRQEGLTPLLCNKEDIVLVSGTMVSQSQMLFEAIIECWMAMGHTDKARQLSRAYRSMATADFNVPKFTPGH